MTNSIATEPKIPRRSSPPRPAAVEPAPLHSPQLAAELSRLKAAEQAERDRKAELARLGEVAHHD